MSKLLAYVKAHPKKQGLRCLVCSMPERQDIEAARASGATYPQIVEGLLAPKSEGGYGLSREKVTIGKIKHHLRWHAAKKS